MITIIDNSKDKKGEKYFITMTQSTGVDKDKTINIVAWEDRISEDRISDAFIYESEAIIRSDILILIDTYWGVLADLLKDKYVKIYGDGYLHQILRIPQYVNHFCGELGINYWGNQQLTNTEIPFYITVFFDPQLAFAWMQYQKNDFILSKLICPSCLQKDPALHANFQPIYERLSRDYYGFLTIEYVYSTIENNYFIRNFYTGFEKNELKIITLPTISPSICLFNGNAYQHIDDRIFIFSKDQEFVYTNISEILGMIVPENIKNEKIQIMKPAIDFITVIGKFLLA